MKSFNFTKKISYKRKKLPVKSLLLHTETNKQITTPGGSVL